jgi:hypothetical protein
MSRERLKDLLGVFRGQGWDLDDLKEFDLVGREETIRWKLTQATTCRQIQVEFHLFGDLGQATEDLDQILYCECQGERLYFEKKTSAAWMPSLQRFVQHFS